MTGWGAGRALCGVSVHAGRRCAGDESRGHGGLPSALLDLFDEVRGLVAELDLRDAESLLQHGEPAEGVSNLAWALASSNAQVAPHLGETIRELIPEDEPPDRFRVAQ